MDGRIADYLAEIDELAGGRLLSTPEESDVFAALGLVFIPPIARLGPINEPQRIDPIWNYEEPQ